MADTAERERPPFCGECDFWKPANYAPNTWHFAGACRRHAPLATGGLHGPSETIWPTTRPHDWCGDFVMADKPELAARGPDIRSMDDV